MAFFSTNALEGIAKAMVVRVGPNTLMGKLASLATMSGQGLSPIGIEMDRFILIMTIRSLVFGGCFFILGLIMHYSWTDAVFFVIGIVVANVPEGLAVTFTMVLSVTAKRMAKKNCNVIFPNSPTYDTRMGFQVIDVILTFTGLVKHLHAVEGLGSTSVICSDKV